VTIYLVYEYLLLCRLHSNFTTGCKHILHIYTTALGQKSHLRHLILQFVTLAARYFQISREYGVQAYRLQLRSLTHNHPEGITVPHTKFDQDPLKTVAVHKEKRTHRHLRFYTYVYKIYF